MPSSSASSHSSFHWPAGRRAALSLSFDDARPAGHEIGNHTIRHPCSANFCWSRDSALEDYTLADMEAEILAANDRIRDLLGVVPRTFAYPCGQTFVGRGADCASYVPVVARHFLAGRGFMSETFNNPSVCDLAQLCAAACDGLSFEQLRSAVNALIEEGGWMILCGHEVRVAGGQTVQGSVLDEFCACVSALSPGLWVDTVAAVGEHVRGERKRSGGY